LGLHDDSRFCGGSEGAGLVQIGSSALRKVRPLNIGKPLAVDALEVEPIDTIIVYVI